MFLATLIPHHFLAALEAIGLGEVLELPGVEGRFENVMQPGTAREVRDRIEARFAEQDREAWLRVLHAHGVPSGPVGTREAWFEGETVAANEMRVTLPHPELGPVSLPGVPAKLRDTPGSVRHLAKPVSARELLAERERRAERTASPREPGQGPLAGVRVLDLGVIIAAPFASQALDIAFGKQEIFYQQPTRFYYPGLPQIQFYERSAFPWLEELEAAIDKLRSELLAVYPKRCDIAARMP